MSISPIGLNSNCDRTSFGSILKIKGDKWNKELYNKLITLESPSLDRLLHENDVTIRQISKMIPDDTTKSGVKGYNIAISVIRENSILAHILDFLHLMPSYKIADRYMPAEKLAESINEKSISKIYDKTYKM